MKPCLTEPHWRVFYEYVALYRLHSLPPLHIAYTGVAEMENLDASETSMKDALKSKHLSYNSNIATSSWLKLTRSQGPAKIVVCLKHLELWSHCTAKTHLVKSQLNRRDLSKPNPKYTEIKRKSYEHNIESIWHKQKQYTNFVFHRFCYTFRGWAFEASFVLGVWRQSEMLEWYFGRSWGRNKSRIKIYAWNLRACHKYHKITIGTECMVNMERWHKLSMLVPCCWDRYSPERTTTISYSFNLGALLLKSFSSLSSPGVVHAVLFFVVFQSVEAPEGAPQRGSADLYEKQQGMYNNNGYYIHNNRILIGSLSINICIYITYNNNQLWIAIQIPEELFCLLWPRKSAASIRAAPTKTWTVRLA